MNGKQLLAVLFALCFTLGCTRDITETSPYYNADKDAESEQELDETELADETKETDPDEGEEEWVFPNIEVSPFPLDFVCAPYGTTHKTLLIGNERSPFPNDLTIYKIEISKEAQTLFSFDRLSDKDYPFTIKYGESLSFDLVLTIECPGTHATKGELIIYSNDPVYPELKVPLSSGCKCCLSPKMEITPDTREHDFGTVKLGQTTEEFIVEFKNPLDNSCEDTCCDICCNQLFIYKIEFSGEPDFLFDGKQVNENNFDYDPPIMLGCQNWKLFNFSLKGKTVGKKSATFKFIHNGLYKGLHQLKLQANVVE